MVLLVVQLVHFLLILRKIVCRKGRSQDKEETSSLLRQVRPVRRKCRSQDKEEASSFRRQVRPERRSLSLIRYIYQQGNFGSEVDKEKPFVCCAVEYNQ